MTGIEISQAERSKRDKEVKEKALFREAYLHSLAGFTNKYEIKDNGTNAEWLCNAAFDMALETVKLFSSYGDKL